jgi:glycerophosphoryl diester phosphodiesterase
MISLDDFHPPFIAHRGASVDAPENTMAAFRAARDSGALWIAADVKLTADGVAVLFRDQVLERSTNGKGAVADMSWADMQCLDSGVWFSPEFAGTHVTRLSELLIFARDAGLRLILELNPCPGRAQATSMVALIEAAKLWPENLPPPMISSWDGESLVRAAQLHPEWPRMLVLNHWNDNWRERASHAQISALDIDAAALTDDRLAALRAYNIPLFTHTVNDPEKARALLQQGIDAVLTADPAKLLRAC